ncbi:Pentatricopeptide repeat-containing protein chloroplastic [Arabidopsis thaliana]
MTILTVQSSLSSSRVPVIKNANFDQIPSWVSLKSSTSSPSVKISHKQGQVENLHLVSLSKHRKLNEAFEFLQEMDKAGVSVSSYSYQCLFEACRELRSLSHGRLLHDRMRMGIENPSVLLQNCVLQMYCECRSLEDADKLFDEMSELNAVSRTTMISAYAEQGILDKAVGLFSGMLASGDKPPSSMYTTLLKSLVNPRALDFGRQIHAHVIRAGLCSNTSIETGIVNMYVKCGWLVGAKRVFDQMAVKKPVACTGLMVGYTQAGRARDALKLFVDLVTEGVEWDSFVFSVVLKACASLEELNLGKQIHACVAKLGLESEVSVGTPLVDFYIKCSSFESACRAFQEIREPNDVSWSAIISGYCQMSQFEEAVKTFKSLRSKNASILNSFTYTSIFQACSVLADCNIGGQVHADAIKRSLIGSQYGESALITMYSKCGCLDDANEVFESMDNPDIVAWTAFISGHAYYGNASEALRLFEKMVSCGKALLGHDASKYNVAPTIDHYDCMIDIYARSGLLDEALKFMKNMPFEPDAMSWKCFLSGCWTHKNLELGEIAGEELRQLDPEDTAGYVLPFNLYTWAGKWEEAAEMMKLMNERMLKKELSCSWIQEKGKIHRFIVGDKHHPQTQEIYEKLKEFDGFMEGDMFQCNMTERREQLLDHSERLAIAFGLISVHGNARAPIKVFKNLRACPDCHEFAKHVSLVTGHEIVIRDSRRFHHFKEGKCSCNDYW